MTHSQPDGIIFYYKKQDLFDLVEQETTYRAKTLRTKEGESLLDDYALTTDETDVFEKYAKEAVQELAASFQKLTYGVDKPYYADEDIILDNSGVDLLVHNRYGVKITNNNPPAALISNTDTIFQDFIISSILMKWYLNNGLTDEGGKWYAKIKDITVDLGLSILPGYRCLGL